MSDLRDDGEEDQDWQHEHTHLSGVSVLASRELIAAGAGGHPLPQISLIVGSTHEARSPLLGWASCLLLYRSK